MEPKEVKTIIDNADFTATVNSGVIDFLPYNNLIITVVVGAMTETPTMTIKTCVVDSNGNELDYDTSMTAISAGSTKAFKVLNNIPHNQIKIYATLGGTGTGKKFAGVTLEAVLSAI